MKAHPLPEYPPVLETFEEIKEVFGTFEFKQNPDGSVIPDWRWVSNRIAL